MEKSKIVTSLMICVLLLAGLATPVNAANQVQIQNLPSYINVNNFKLSCSAITTQLVDGDPGTTTYAQFYVTKDGGSETAFGPSIDLSVSPCQVQVTNLQITEEKGYTFAVKLNSGESSSTSTIFDNSGPSIVSNYYKDGLNDGVRIHWTNPSDSDFSKVIIYRGETPDFSADSNHEITTQTGGAGAPMTYEDHSTPPMGKTYYYNIRAIDKAGNSSGLVGDGGGVVTVSQTSTPTESGSNVIIVPKENGSVLGTEATTSPSEVSGEESAEGGIVDKINEFANKTPEPFKWILTHKKVSIGIALALLAAAYILYRLSKKNR